MKQILIRRRSPAAGLATLVIGLAACVVCIVAAPSAPAAGSEAPAGSGLNQTRRFTFEYEVSIGPFSTDAGPIDIFVPVPVEDAQQHVISLDVDSELAGTIETESRYGNRFWHAHLASAPEGRVSIVLRTEVERRVNTTDPPRTARTLTESERAELERFLEPNERVVIDDQVLDPILAEIRASSDSEDRAALARAIYDWIVANIEYKKIGQGWGNGDTFWACTQRYGNCTDFHSLFISLARTEGIPARFEMGFPVPTDRESGRIGGYHCWVQFYLPDAGWFPIDASEAFKNPDKRDLFYGTHPADRIHFSTGRDIRLGPSHRDRPLNYFVYPYVEVSGRRWEGRIESTFRYEDGVAISREQGGGADLLANDGER